MICKRYRYYTLIGLVLFISLTFSFNPIILFSELKTESKVNQSAMETREEQWLNNNDFSTLDSWFYSKGAEGDNSSVEANISNNQANYRVLGKTQTFNNRSLAFRQH